MLWRASRWFPKAPCDHRRGFSNVAGSRVSEAGVNVQCWHLECVITKLSSDWFGIILGMDNRKTHMGVSAAHPEGM